MVRKSVEDQHRKIQDKKDKVRPAGESNQLIETVLRRDALELQVIFFLFVKLCPIEAVV